MCAQDFHQALTGPPGGAGALATGGAIKDGRRRVVIDTRNHFETAVGR